MVKMKEDKSLSYMSVAIGIISLGFVIFTTEDIIFQIGFIIIMIISVIAYSILANRSDTDINKREIDRLSKELKGIKNTISLHERLIKIEKEVFKK